jgi:hypothetical protein
LYWNIGLLKLRIGVQGLLVLGSALHCHIYDHERAKLAVQLKTIDESFDLLHLLTRDSNKEKHQNKLTLSRQVKTTTTTQALDRPCYKFIVTFMSHLNIFPYMDVKHSKGQKFRNGH